MFAMNKIAIVAILTTLLTTPSPARADPAVVVGTPDPNPPAASPAPAAVISPAVVLPAVVPPEDKPATSAPPSPAPAVASPDIPGGGCFFKNPDGTCALSAEPSVALALAAVDLKTGKYVGGPGSLPQGICYGVTYQPGRWYASGANFCLAVAAGTGTSTTITTSVSLSLLHFGALGIASLCREGEERLYCHAILLFGATVRAR